MTNTQEILVAPFRIIAHVREEQDGWRFEGLADAADPTRALRVPIEYQYLDLADYTVEGLPLYIVRKHAAELAKAVQHWPESVAEELAALRALEVAGASCLVVIEGSEEEIERILHDESDVFAEAGVGVPWLFAPSRSAAEKVVFAVIKRAWQRAQEGW